MRKVTSKFLSLFLAGCMLCGSVSTPVYANPTETVNPEEESKTENNSEVTDQNAENTPTPEEPQPAPEEVPPTEDEIPEETPEETPKETPEETQKISVGYTIDPSKFDFSKFSSTIIYNKNQSVYTLSEEEKNSPEMKAVAEELDNIKVVAAESEQPIPLTEEQKQRRRLDEGTEQPSGRSDENQKRVLWSTCSGIVPEGRHCIPCSSRCQW